MYWRIFTLAFLGKLVAAIFIAACVFVGFGPDKWIEFIFGHGVWIARILFLVFGIITFGALLYFWRSPPNSSVTQPPKDGATLTLLPPPFHYELTWNPLASLQIITQLTFAPVGSIKPDTRIPVFYVKNLTNDFLKDVRVNWSISTQQIENAVKASASFRRYGAKINTSFAQMRDHVVPLSDKGLILTHKNSTTEHSSVYPFSGSECHTIEFIDPAGKSEVCPYSVLAAAEIFLAAGLAGMPMDAYAKIPISCEIEARGIQPQRFRISISARSSRSTQIVEGKRMADGDDVRASLKIEIFRDRVP